MKKKGIVFLGMLLISCMVAAQSTTVSTFQMKGVLLDSLTQEGEPYATIKVAKKEAPDKPLKMWVSDLKGKFQEKVAGTGHFVMTITSVGRRSILKNFTVKAEEKLVDFGTLYVTDATNELGQVEVVAQKPLVKADIDKIEYNVQDDPDSKSNTVLEMLRKVPLVTVDGEDKIKVNGSSSFKVHVNGKPNNMMSNNPTEVLKSMPANSIKYIEVITNPGAKYDAEGVGGILNIVTVGSGFEGYTATFSANASNMGMGGSAYATVKQGKFTVTGNYSVNYNNRPVSYVDDTRDNLNEAGEVTTRIVNNGKSDNRGSFQQGNLEASYEIDTLQLLTMSVGMYGGSNKGDNWGRTFMTEPNSMANALPIYQYGSHAKDKGSWYSIRGNIDYQLSSARVKERMLTLSYKINTQPRTSDGYNRYTYEADEMPEEWLSFLRLKNLRTDGKQNSTEHTFQVDYTTPIAKIHTLETGMKYIIRDNTSENWRYEAKNNTSNEYELNKDRSTNYQHLNDILAAYLGYSLKVKKISAKAGLRYERTMQHVKYIVGEGEDFKVNFNDWVPSATVGYKLTDLSNIRLGYNLRIWRPSIWYLNPYVNDVDATHISKGNPNLESEKSHSFNLSYSNFTQKFNINLSARYSFNNSGIEQVTKLIHVPDPDGGGIPGVDTKGGKDVLFSTYKNIGRSKSGGVSGYLNWNATAKTRIYVNFSVDYSYLNSPAQNLTNSGWNCFAYGGVQHTFPLDIRASLNLMGATPYVTLQGKGSSFYDYNMSVNRSFLKDKRLTLTAFAGNFFQKYVDSKDVTEGTGFRQENNYRYSRMRYGVSVSYRIGELKASVKKAARSINNDDVKSGGTSGGGGAE